ncbi:MAG: helix-turn-helix transcriptional regulator [Clostridia bacterium]|nr:helix-turn-helix transcriptional regulator [Clostridia bacterium]
MELKISENLRMLRKERGNTQDELASHLGISVQAVSKWERGDGFPDITLLPRIAFYYNVSVDDILGCNSLRKQEEIEAFKQQAQILANKGKRKERLTLCREMQKKYPNDEDVLYNLMYDLWAVDRTANSEEIICIANKLLKSDSLEMRYGAIQLLAFTYSKLGEDEKAVVYAKMVPCNKDLLSSVLKGKELVEHCRWYFWNVCATMLRLSQSMMQYPEAGYTAEERHAILETIYRFYHAIFSDGDFGFWENRLGQLCLDMALSSVEMGNTEQALDELDKMCEHAEKYQKFTSIKHTSLLVRGLEYNSSQSASTDEYSIAYSFLCSLNDNPRFKPLHDDERLQTIKNKLQAIG